MNAPLLKTEFSLASLQSKKVLGRAHRIRQRKDPSVPPRTLVMKFLDHRDRVVVAKVSRAKKQILYKTDERDFLFDEWRSRSHAVEILTKSKQQVLNYSS